MLPDAFGPKNLGLKKVWPEMLDKLIRSVRNCSNGPMVAGRLKAIDFGAGRRYSLA
jgi:hypothetical protein